MTSNVALRHARALYFKTLTGVQAAHDNEMTLVQPSDKRMNRIHLSKTALVSLPFEMPIESTA